MSQWLPYLLVLVCPISMGVMMWLMMRGQGQAQRLGPQVAKLESEIKELRSTLRQQGAAEQNGSGASSVTADKA